MSEELSIVINAQDYASESLRGISGSLRSFGRDAVMVSSNFKLLTNELGIQVPFLNEVMKWLNIVGVTMRLVGAASHMLSFFESERAASHALAAGQTMLAVGANGALATSHAVATGGTLAHMAAVLGLNAALLKTVLLSALVTGGLNLLLGAVAYGAAKVAVPSMQSGGLVSREGVYYLHSGELVVPRSSITSTAYGSTFVSVYFENRAPISSEVDREALLRDLGREVAERTRRAG